MDNEMNKMDVEDLENISGGLDPNVMTEEEYAEFKRRMDLMFAAGREGNEEEYYKAREYFHEYRSEMKAKYET